MKQDKSLVVFFITIMVLVLSPTDCHSRRRILKQKIRNNNKFFVRLTIKNNIFPNSILFAYGSGYRINWDMNPSPRSTRSLSNFRDELISALHHVLEREGFESETCLIRAACEVNTLDLQNGDIIDRLLHVFFRREKMTDINDCSSKGDLYSECRLSLVNLAGYILESFFIDKSTTTS